MDSTRPPAQVLRRISRVLALGLAASGMAVQAGWIFGWAPLRGLPGYPALKPSGAAAMFAAGLSTALLAPTRHHPVLARLGKLLALALVAFCGVLLVERTLGRDLGVESLFTRGLSGGSDLRTSTTALSALLLVGVALLALDREMPGGGRPAQALALVAALVPVQALIAYCYGLQPARVGNAFTQVGLPGALGLVALCAAVLLARPEHGIVKIVVSSSPAGVMARRMLVVFVLLPVLLGWLFLVAGLRAGQYEAMVGASLVVLSAVVTGAATVWWNARSIQRVDEMRTSIEEKLRAEREWSRTTLASIGDAVIAADHLGRVSDLNPVAEALTGLRAADALGRPVETVFRIHGANRRALESPFARVSREGRMVNLPRETMLVGRAGETFPVEGCAAPIRDERGRPRGAVLVFRDISERRRVEEERSSLLARERAARAEAEQASRAKDEFIATLSHELRTPLNSVLGWARLLRLGKLDGRGVQRAVEAIERGATTQAQIVDDLLDMARIVRGQLRLDVRAVDLVPVIEAAIDTVRPAAVAREIEIAAVLDPRAGQAAGDPGRLQQVVWNLLTNAVKFTPSGGKVEVRLGRGPESVLVSVSDTGAGIPHEFLPHVFERFRQADSSTTRAHGGLGLGLAIVRHIVEAHGGSVAADSAGPGLGSSFTVSLPLWQNRPVAKVVEAPRPAPRMATPSPSPASLRGLRIVVVDDDPDTLDLVRQLLEDAGAAVRAVGSAAEALEALRRAPPDALLSDIGMPGEDGYELIRKVRALPPEEGGQVPAAALTAFAHFEHRQQALSSGYQLYLAKPIDPAELTAAVARLAAGAAAQVGAGSGGAAEPPASGRAAGASAARS